MTFGILFRPGPSVIDPNLRLAMGQELVFRNFSTATFLESFAPDPSTGSLRIPILSEKADTLRLAILSDRNAAAFLKTAERFHSEYVRFAESAEEGFLGSWKIFDRLNPGGIDVTFDNEERVVVIQRNVPGSGRSLFEIQAGLYPGNYLRQTVSIDPQGGPRTTVYEIGISSEADLMEFGEALGVGYAPGPDLPRLYRKILGRGRGIHLKVPLLPLLALLVGQLVCASKQYPVSIHKMELLAEGLINWESQFKISPKEIREATKDGPTAEIAQILGRLDSLEVRMPPQRDGAAWFSVTGVERDTVNESGMALRIELRPVERNRLMPLVPALREKLWEKVRWLIENPVDENA